MTVEGAIEDKLKKIVCNSLNNFNFEDTLCAISALARIYYEKNQFFNSSFLETNLKKLSDSLSLHVLGDSETKKEYIFFYDGFGLDNRGLALIYLKALCSLNNKRIVYATKLRSKRKQTLITEVLRNSNAEIVYFTETSGYLKQIEQINEFFVKYKPAVAFVYTTPWDVAGITVFNKQSNIKRFQINLTDHAFWLGINMFDVCVEFRDYGYSISKDYRKIPEDKLTMLPFYPHIENDCKFEGLPFSIEGKKLIFSGGALYKTLSDDNKYYIIVEDILSKHSDVIFLYAGSGDDTKLRILIEKFPRQVYHIDERKDFYKIIEKSYFYLNTYPHLGGLMTQYAVAAGKLPITLKYDQGSEGLLLNQNKISVFYDTIEKLLEDVHKLLTDKNYLVIKENEIKDSLMSEKRFKIEISNLVEYNKTTILPNYQSIDVEKMRQEYLFRFTNDIIWSAIANKRNKALIKYFPFLFVKRFIKLKLGFYTSKS